MKKFFVRLTALLMVSASLMLSGCDSGYMSNSSSNALTTQNGNEVTTAQSSTKYPHATIPSQSTDLPTTDMTESITMDDISDEKMSELITQKYLSIHPDSRPGDKLEQLKNIVIHYVANPGTSALQNWKYFENKNSVSAHFIIDLDGSIIQCMPLDEVAWAIGTQEGNYSTISIECCHPDSTGKFTPATYESLLKLVSWLCQEYGLTADQVKRHYDYPRKNSSGIVWHKSCPLYFVDHPEKWEEFKSQLLIP